MRTGLMQHRGQDQLAKGRGYRRDANDEAAARRNPDRYAAKDKATKESDVTPRMRLLTMADTAPRIKPTNKEKFIVMICCLIGA